MPRFKVVIRRTLTETAIVEVEADNDLIAGDVAEDMEGVNWKFYDSNVEAVDCEEIKEAD